MADIRKLKLLNIISMHPEFFEARLLNIISVHPEFFEARLFDVINECVEERENVERDYDAGKVTHAVAMQRLIAAIDKMKETIDAIG